MRHKASGQRNRLSPLDPCTGLCNTEPCARNPPSRIQRFDAFLKENDEQVQAAIRRAEAEARVRRNRRRRRGRVSCRLDSVRLRSLPN